MTYAQKKEAARQEAIEWQTGFNKSTLYWSDIATANTYFEIIGKRYGLLKEFRENGIL